MAGSSGDVSGACHAGGWRRALAAHGGRAGGGTPIMPDGCLDLLWDGNAPVRRRPGHGSPLAPESGTAPPMSHCASRAGSARRCWASPRTSCGIGPRTSNELWPARQARVLTERVEARPRGGVGGVGGRARRSLRSGPARTACPGHGEGAGRPIAEMADRLGLSTRQLHRRCLPAFGYGPKHLARVMRFGPGARSDPQRCAPGPGGGSLRVCRPVAPLPGGTRPGRHDSRPGCSTSPTRTAAKRTGRPADRRDRERRRSACPRTHPTARDGPRSRRR